MPTRARSEIEEPAVKRRKVRKGTQSCWECRRRKVRCILANATTKCDNCRRRGTTCISQEHDDIPTPVASRVEAAPSLSRNGSDIVKNLSDVGEFTRPKSPLRQLSPVATTSPVNSRRAAGRHLELSLALIAVWPSQQDIDLICTLPVGLSAHLHGGICIPYSSSMRWDPPSLQEMLQLPPPGSHPVLLARKLLMLGTILQGVPPSSIRDLPDRGVSFLNIMSLVVETAIRLVTTNEDLVRSVEGIECIMIEAMYQNYAGNLHRAWMATRRAITVAQIMALHRGLSSPSLKIVEPETWAVFNPDQICFRLVEMDYYLSLMLGLPCTSLEARFATPKALEGCDAIDRLQRIHCAMADRILRRNESDPSETYDIDRLLQKAAAEMPPQWWLMPNLSTSDSEGTQVLHTTIRLMDQFSHYHLLIRLHLPYMLRYSPNHRYDNSKIIAVNTSREVLARYIAFRTSNPAHYYCRGTDFLAFIATTVMCLAHIDTHSHHSDLDHNSNPDLVLSFLAHSRPSDRGLMERTLDINESMAAEGTDAIASKIARFLSHLLHVEASAAKGTSYSTITSTSANATELECEGKLTHDGKGLQVHIPHFGTINFNKRLSASQIRNSHLETLHFDQPLSLPQQNLPFPLTTSNNVFSSNSNSDGRNVSEEGFAITQDQAEVEEDDWWDLQGVDVALFDSLLRNSGTAVTDSGTIEEQETWAQWFGGGVAGSQINNVPL